MKKRLFVFASYDKDGIVDNTLLHYLKSLSELGDIVFTMDNDISKSEMEKIKKIPNVLHADATRHGEYDFGSYKCGYLWAYDNKILNKYDWVYLVNDSVYGPLWNLEHILTDLESRGADLTGMTDYISSTVPIHVQSWFVGLSKCVANSDFIKDFLSGVCSQTTKEEIVLKYEVGLSQIILQHGYKMDTFIKGQNGDVCHELYYKPLKMLSIGLPLVKKAAINKLGNIAYLYPYTSDEIIQDIYNNAKRANLLSTSTQTTELYSEYQTYYRLTLFSIPLIRVKRQKLQQSKTVSYKVYLFDKLPVFKISVTK